MDGTLGSQTARLLDGSGVEITSRDEFAEIVRRAARAGFPVAVHAIGDQANRDALDAFEAAADEWRPRGLRPRIEHAQLLAEEDFAPVRRARGGRVGAVHARPVRPRPRRGRAGPTRPSRAYAWRSLLDAGAVRRERLRRPGGGARPAVRASAPASRARSTSAMPGIRSRRSPSSRRCTRPRVTPGLARGRRAAPRARSCPGYLADLVVLDRDPVEMPPEELADVQVVATMLGGRWVHGGPPFA